MVSEISSGPRITLTRTRVGLIRIVSLPSAYGPEVCCILLTDHPISFDKVLLFVVHYQSNLPKGYENLPVGYDILWKQNFMGALTFPVRAPVFYARNNAVRTIPYLRQSRQYTPIIEVEGSISK